MYTSNVHEKHMAENEGDALNEVFTLTPEGADGAAEMLRLTP